MMKEDNSHESHAGAIQYASKMFLELYQSEG